MTNFCPQCGYKVAAGAQVCPQCGMQLKLILQSNSNNNMGSSYNSSGIRKRDAMMGRTAYIEHPDPLSYQGLSLQYNTENADPNEVKLVDDDMSITGITEDLFSNEQSEQDKQKEIEQQNKIHGTVPVMETLSGMMEGSKYRIVTQVYDKKTGFNAVELESKLNMYAKMGYHIVPNTMICQPGQDFFALMEKNSEPMQTIPVDTSKE